MLVRIIKEWMLGVSRFAKLEFIYENKVYAELQEEEQRVHYV